jgi:hypothetical protein
VKRGDRVVYRRRPGLFGVMEVTWVLANGRIECLILDDVDRAVSCDRVSTEEFDAGELVLTRELLGEAA